MGLEAGQGKAAPLRPPTPRLPFGMPRRRVLLATLVLFSSASLASAPPAAGQAAVPAAVEPYDGAVSTGLALRRLGNTARVLHIAAHPDDENTALFSPLALGLGVDAAYMSLTRGEGGQNSIGPELSTGLGIIRSEELLAARRLDGGRQFFGRAIDYGYSKSADEAFRRWPRDELLSDVVEVIRRYRPDVVVSVWSGTERDGHGQHQASGVIAREAVLAAGDPDRFPEQLAAGLRPHMPALYYRSAWFSERPPDVELNTGVLDPLLGRSYHQVAMASRSLHRSQDQGRRLEPGPRRTAFHRIDPAGDEPVAETRVFGRYEQGPPLTDRSLFEGVDTLLSQRARRVAGLAGGRSLAAHDAGSARSDGGPRADVVDRLREYEALVERARREYNPFEPWRLLPVLVQAQEQLAGTADLLDQDGRDAVGSSPAAHASGDLDFHLAAELDDLRDAMLAAANVRVDVVAEREWVVPGQTFRLELGIWNGGVEAVSARAAPLLPDSWTWLADQDVDELAVGPGERVSVAYDVTVPPEAGYTTPYYLDPAEPATGTMYRWPDEPDVRGLPFAAAPVRGSFLVRLPGARALTLEREAAWIGVDRRAGEFHRPVKVVPPASVAVDPDLLMVPTMAKDREREVTVLVRAHAPEGVAGELRLSRPPGWSVSPGNVAVHIEDDGEHPYTFRLTPAEDAPAGEYEVGAVLATSAGELDLGFQVIDYPHIAPNHLYGPARARVRILDVEVAPVRVGYIAGAPDGVPEALDRLGLEWRALASSDLANGDLDAFDVIVTGIRAYELRDDLVAGNRRLLDWVRRGGTLIVQYNQYAALQRDYTPWPVTIARPHGRVTDPEAPVGILEPEHRIFNSPNRIGAVDWDAWVQERGLYFLDTWDGPLTPLLAMSDAGEEPLTGGLLTAPLGDGKWVYSGLALFRQLPQGVPGAYRLLANLLSLGATP
jgi:LmbE family N-acetylglucosaminyl deacetylase